MNTYGNAQQTYIGIESFGEFGATLDPPLSTPVANMFFNNCVRQPDNRRKFIYGPDSQGMRSIIGREPVGPRPGLVVVLREDIGIPPYTGKTSFRSTKCAEYLISCQSIVALLPQLEPIKSDEDAFIHQLGTKLMQMLDETAITKVQG